MLMLTHAKGYREVVRAQDQHEWLLDSPGKLELAGTRALLLGLGAIGGLIKTRLEAFDVEVVPAVDLSLWRGLPVLVGLALLIFWLIWEVR